MGQWKPYLIEVHKGISLRNFKMRNGTFSLVCFSPSPPHTPTKLTFYPSWLSNCHTRRDNINPRISLFAQAPGYCFSLVLNISNMVPGHKAELCKLPGMFHFIHWRGNAASTLSQHFFWFYIKKFLSHSPQPNQLRASNRQSNIFYFVR